MLKDFEEILIDKNKTVIQAMQQLDMTAKKILFVIDKDYKLIGSLTDGDIRRWILKGGSLDSKIEEVSFKQTYYVYHNYDLEEVKQDILDKKIVYVPVLNHDGSISEFLVWDRLVDDKLRKTVRKPIDLPVVIMAGGKGTRLDPFTSILPKPLIPVNDRSMLELIIDNFTEYSINDFYITVNYKSKVIKSYFEEVDKNYNLYFIDESKPLGTAGSLSLLKGEFNSDFILTNCDIIIEADYLDIVNHHFESENDITIVASMKNYKIPYGVCEIENGGNLKNIVEKPEYNFLVNTGMYIMRKDIINLIPDDTFFHMTDLINSAKNNEKKIGVYPISEKSWIDTGEWEEYKKALNRLTY